MAGLYRAFRRRNTNVSNYGAPVMCLDAGSLTSYSGSGTTWTDLSGNSNNGTLVNSPTYNSSNYGSLVFNGTNQYGSTPISLGGYTKYTIIAWFNTATGGKEILATYGVTNIFEFFIQTTGKISAYVYGSSGTAYRQSTASVNTGAWFNCAGVYDGASGTLNTYVNGALDNGTLTGTISTALNSGASTAVIANVNSGSYYFNGNIAAIVVYNRALSASEIFAYYEMTRGRYAGATTTTAAPTSTTTAAPTSTTTSAPTSTTTTAPTSSTTSAPTSTTTTAPSTTVTTTVAAGAG